MSHRLLLADDSVTIRRVIELTFADERVRVDSVSSGRDAIASIEASPPDIILADAGMPDVSGYDIAAFVKGRSDLRHIPVILLAGAFEPLDEARARTSGSDGVLVKPFEPQMVVARVRELLPETAAPQAAPVSTPAARTEPPAEVPLEKLDAAFDGRREEPPAIESTPAALADDFRELPSAQREPAGFERQDFGDWDLSVRPPAGEPGVAADAFAPPEPEPIVPPLPPPIALTPKAPAAPRSAAPPAQGDAPLADAFTNLLAAEEGRPHAPSAPAGGPGAQLTDAEMDVIVDRVIARLGLGVRGTVIDLAERLVKAEIDRLKALR